MMETTDCEYKTICLLSLWSLVFHFSNNKTVFNFKYFSLKLLPPANVVCEGYVSTGESVHRGSAPLHAGIPPPARQTPPWQGDPPGKADPSGKADPPVARRPPWQKDPPQARQTPPSACWEIRSTSGRYASYWNAILFITLNVHGKGKL